MNGEFPAAGRFKSMSENWTIKLGKSTVARNNPIPKCSLFNIINTNKIYAHSPVWEEQLPTSKSNILWYANQIKPPEAYEKKSILQQNFEKCGIHHV